MTIELKKIASVGAILTALTAAPAMAQDIGEWDGDGSGTLNEEEFTSGFNENVGAFDSWDEDGDGSLTEEEYNAGIFDSYDDDENGEIEEPEFGDVGDDMGDGGFWDV